MKLVDISNRSIVSLGGIKMNKHEEVRKSLSQVLFTMQRAFNKKIYDDNNMSYDVKLLIGAPDYIAYTRLNDYITQSEAAEKELEGLKAICENGKKEFGLGLPTELQYLQYEEVDGARAVFEYLFKTLSKVGK